MAKDNAQCTIHNAQRRYIDVDKFAEKICNFQQIDEDTANKMIFLLRTFPTADVEEVKHGEWERIIRNGKPRGIQCSLCGKQLHFHENYCPRCGAKMDGGKEE